MTVTPPTPDDLVSPVFVSENAQTVFKKRYLRKGPNGEPVEDERGAFWRVAYNVALADDEFGGNVEDTARRFYDLIASFDFLPNSPTFTGAGTPLGQLSACFVLELKDEMGAEKGGIFDTLRTAALIQKTGGGNGFAFSRLRPKGALVKSSMGQASGPVGFLKVYDRAFGEICQGGSRRGANMGVLRSDHPDIEEFIECKSIEGKIANFNISVGIQDSFMRAAKEGGDWDLVFDGKTYKTVNARELFWRIIKNAHKNGEPGALFLDAAARANAVPHLYELEASNPCITGDTWVMTSRGARQVLDLVGVPFGAAIDGSVYQSSGFWSTGIQDVIQINTKEGLNLKLTPNHKVLVVTRQTKHTEITEWRPAGDLRAGDKIKIHNHASLDWEGRGNFQEGWLIGSLIGDGHLRRIGTAKSGEQKVRATLGYWGPHAKEMADSALTMLRETVKTRSDLTGNEIPDRGEWRISSTGLRDLAASYGVVLDNKTITPEIEQSNREFHKGFLRGLFDADGSPQGNLTNGFSIRLSQSNLGLLESAQRMLLRLGISSRIYKNRRLAGYRPLPDSNREMADYYCQAQHELVVSGINVKLFDDVVGFSKPDKHKRLHDTILSYKRSFNAEKFTHTISDVSECGQEEVFDCSVPEMGAFDANGVWAHNCGEQFLGPDESCTLGSVNLSRFAIKNEDGTYSIDWNRLRDAVRLATHFLDNVVSVNQYVPAIPAIKEAALKTRRIGLGVMGFADLLYMLGIRYGSPLAQEVAAQVAEFVRYHAMRESVRLANERGAFPAFKGSIYDTTEDQNAGIAVLVRKHRESRGRLLGVMGDEFWNGLQEEQWAQLGHEIRWHGIRNACQTTVAPTGTLSTVSGVEGYGCEPVFALAYTRWLQDGETRVPLQYVSPLFKEALERLEPQEEERQRIIRVVSETGTCKGTRFEDVFVVAADITTEEHVRMQAAFQRFTSNAVSKCVIGDTLILTTNGLVPISSLSKMRETDQFESHDLEIISPIGAERSDYFYYGGMRETRKVTFEYGYELEGTPNHRIHVLSDDGNIRFAYLEDLKVGDTAVIYSGQMVYGTPSQYLPSYNGEFLSNSKKIQFPERMTETLAYILGCITSEGSVGQNAIQICNSDKSLLTRLGDCVRDVFGINTHIAKDSRREVYSLQINSRHLCRWLLSEIGINQGAQNKTIPDCILRSSKQEIVSFLRGLFLDAYMTLDGRMFGIGLASHRLIMQLQVLFLNMGVFSRVHKSGPNAWSLTVAGKALDVLAEFIEFDETWKTERIGKRNEGRAKSPANIGTMLPEVVSKSLNLMRSESDKLLQSLYDEETYGQDREYKRAWIGLRDSNKINRALAKKLYNHFDDAPNEYADNFFSQDSEGMIYVQVSSIERGFSEVFDISVPGSHSFIAGGMCNHNTINMPKEATEKDVYDAYMLAWELGCKGITVYRAGSRETVVLETKETALAKQPNQSTRIEHDKKPRAKRLFGHTYKTPTPLGEAYITINHNGSDHPFEVFATVGKAGSDTFAVSEAIGRLISLILRLPSEMAPAERMQEVIKQLGGIGGSRHLGFGANRVLSLPDAIAQVLAEHMGTPATPILEIAEARSPFAGQAELCPSCGFASLINEEGCKKCYSCNHSEC